MDLLALSNLKWSLHFIVIKVSILDWMQVIPHGMMVISFLFWLIDESLRNTTIANIPTFGVFV